MIVLCWNCRCCSVKCVLNWISCRLVCSLLCSVVVIMKGCSLMLYVRWCGVLNWFIVVVLLV